MTSRRSGSYGVMDKDPFVALALSVVPGVGQFYNGESRKGLLFLAVSLMNFLCLLLWLVRANIFAFFESFATAFHLSLNQEVKKSLLSIEANSPLGYAMILLLLAFTAYAMRDAFADASFKRLREIYSSSSLAISEATAGSYLMHFLVLSFALLFVFFFCKQPPRQAQYTEIIFNPEQDAPVPKKVVQKKVVSEKPTEASGKHNPALKVTPAAKGAIASKPKIEPKTADAPRLPQPVSAKPVVKPIPQPQPHQQSTSQIMPQPRPSVAPNPVAPPLPVKMPELSKPTPTLPRPTVSQSSSANNALPQPALKLSDTAPKVSNNPQPVATQTNNNLLAALPPASARHQSSFSAIQGAPGPVRDVSTPSGSGNPTPVPSSSRSGPNSGDSSNKAGAPAPAAVNGGQSGKFSTGPAAVIPAMAPGDNGTAREGRGNPEENSRPNQPKISGSREGDIDFSRFMADLQRRIKRAWYPPKAPASANCQLVFKVHPNGEMSGLRVSKSSGIAAYDEAALKAVENAAPFRPLPEGAKEAVDVQFTFDYNVFQGGGNGGSFRRF